MNKRTFMVTSVISVLIISLLGGLPTALVKADPFYVLPYPTIHINSVDGHLYSENAVVISFWIETSRVVECSNFRCWLDDKLMDASVWRSSRSVNLTGLSDGQHTVKFALTARTTTTSSSHVGIYWNTTEVVESTVFSVDATAPTFTVLSWENRTFGTAEVSIGFLIDEPVKELFYCLDGIGNVTSNVISGIAQIKFDYLEEGSHNLTIYANDAAGNTGKSDIYYFTVDTQQSSTPSPSPTPILTPSQEPTMEPTLEPIQTASPTPIGEPIIVAYAPLIEVGTIALIAVVAVGILVYFKGRNGNP